MYNELDGPQQVEMLAASLRANSSDLGAFMEALAAKLKGALPEQTTIMRHDTLFSREHPVKEIIVAFGEQHYILHREKQRQLLAQRSTKVRGIVLKTEQLSVKQWIDEIAMNLAQEAAQSTQTRSALEQFLL